MYRSSKAEIVATMKKESTYSYHIVDAGGRGSEEYRCCTVVDASSRHQNHTTRGCENPEVATGSVKQETGHRRELPTCDDRGPKRNADNPHLQGGNLTSAKNITMEMPSDAMDLPTGRIK